MKPEMIILVDRNDTIIGYTERSNISPKTIHRVSALWITNPRGEILLAQRHRNKKTNPGKWGPAVAGTNEKDETYESNIYKEAEEEIGLTGIEFQTRMKIQRHDSEHPHFCQWFSAVIDRNLQDFQLQEDEVQDIRWWSRSELSQALAENPDLFLRTLPRYIRLFEEAAEKPERANE